MRTARFCDVGCLKETSLQTANPSLLQKQQQPKKSKKASHACHFGMKVRIYLMVLRIGCDLTLHRLKKHVKHSRNILLVMKTSNFCILIQILSSRYSSCSARHKLRSFDLCRWRSSSIRRTVSTSHCTCTSEMASMTP